MKFTVNVSYADGSAAVATAAVADQVAFEDTFDRPISVLSTDFRLKDLTWIAWHGLHRSGKVALDYDAWLSTVDEVSIGSDEAIVPLETPQPTG